MSEPRALAGVVAFFRHVLSRERHKGPVRLQLEVLRDEVVVRIGEINDELAARRALSPESIPTIAEKTKTKENSPRSCSVRTRLRTLASTT